MKNKQMCFWRDLHCSVEAVTGLFNCKCIENDIYIYTVYIFMPGYFHQPRSIHLIPCNLPVSDKSLFHSVYFSTHERFKRVWPFSGPSDSYSTDHSHLSLFWSLNLLRWLFSLASHYAAASARDSSFPFRPHEPTAVQTVFII